jgi:hypothetical protein
LAAATPAGTMAASHRGTPLTPQKARSGCAPAG